MTMDDVTTLLWDATSPTTGGGVAPPDFAGRACPPLEMIARGYGAWRGRRGAARPGARARAAAPGLDRAGRACAGAAGRSRC